MKKLDIPIAKLIKSQLQKTFKRTTTVSTPLPKIYDTVTKPTKGFQDIKREVEKQNKPSEYKYVPYKELKKELKYRRKVTTMA